MPSWNPPLCKITVRTAGRAALLSWMAARSVHFPDAVAHSPSPTLASTASSDVLTQSMVQLSVENHLRGRAMGAWTLAIGSAPLGHLEMGALIVALGVEGALAANGAALVVVGVITALVVPRLRQL